MTTRCTILLVSLVLISCVAQAQEQAKYPPVNVAVAYEVDPAWPTRPKDMPWADMPGIAVDAKDNVYVFTRAVPPVQVYDAKGKFLRSWGDEKLKGAHHVKIDKEGNIWLAVYAAHVVQKYTPEGKLLLTLGTYGEAGRDEKHLDKPTDMAIASNGDIYVSDGYGNARVVQYDKNGKFIRTWGELGHKPGQFSIPHAIAIDSKDRVYVADRNNVRIQIFDANGKFLDEWKNVVTPWGFWMTKDDELWVCGSSPMQWRKTDEALGCPPKDQVFMKFATSGKLLQLWTVPKGSDGLEQPGELNWVHCLALDSKGNIYAGDIKGKKAQKFLRKEP
ncbi:MAG: peptidyl-alpha-hydroxyglycine alpha-amidating lyase family protein [Gemmataceae bacterium]